MIEEIPTPTVDGPLIMVACVAIGLATSLIFIVALLFVSRDIDTIITSGAGPLLQIFLDATNSKVGSICLLLFPIGCLLLGVIAITTTSSRMIYALARDSGLPFSPIWTTVHARLKTPVNALVLNAAAVFCCGCIFLGSSRYSLLLLEPCLSNLNFVERPTYCIFLLVHSTHSALRPSYALIYRIAFRFSSIAYVAANCSLHAHGSSIPPLDGL